MRSPLGVISGLRLRHKNMMFRSTFIFLLLTILAAMGVRAQSRTVVVADSATRIPLPGATLYDRSGKAIGVSDRRGRLVRPERAACPVTVRYLGFDDKSVTSLSDGDTIFLSEVYAELPEVEVSSRKRPILHVLAYVREYSTLASESDTVTLFREKTVDYMLPPGSGTRFRGWSNPRVLASRSCYRFTDSNGLDSVSDKCQLHFSWSDWIGLVPEVTLPAPLRKAGAASSYTLMGRYSPAEVWQRDTTGVTIEIDALADTLSRKWVPDLRGFFHGNLDYQKFKIRYSYDDVDGDNLAPLNLTGYTFDIESDGRGREMFWFNRADDPFYVTTRAEVYILDREFITVKEARKWENRSFDTDMSIICEPLEAPALSPETLALVERVGAIDREGVRLNTAPDQRLVGIHDGARNFRFGHRALSLLKTVTGISSYKARKNRERRWNDFKKAQMERNRRSSR